MTAVRFNHVDVVFGPWPEKALAMLDAGAGRDEIFAKTHNLVAVHDATLSVEEGEICVLMGLSGSGKSSLLRCVNALNKATRGQVIVRHGGGKIDVTQCSQEALYALRTATVSMVFQHFALMPWRTIRQNVALGLELSRMPKDRRKEVVMEHLEMVRLAQWADKYPHELSGGMQQRVGLARALATDASILLMDEPFSALDPLIREHLQDELIQIQSRLKKTILFVSHDLDEALKLGSKIAIMEAGKIVQTASPERIISHPETDYVRQFVASVNPLNVLSCASLMRPADQLARINGKNLRKLDPDGKCIGRLDPAGRLEGITISGQDATLVSFEPELDLKSLSQSVMVTGTPKTPMRAAVTINHETRLPVPILDSDGMLIGVVGAQEIICGILRDCDPKARRAH